MRDIRLGSAPGAFHLKDRPVIPTDLVMLGAVKVVHLLVIGKAERPQKRAQGPTRTVDQAFVMKQMEGVAANFVAIRGKERSIKFVEIPRKLSEHRMPLPSRPKPRQYSVAQRARERVRDVYDAGGKIADRMLDHQDVGGGHSDILAGTKDLVEPRKRLRRIDDYPLVERALGESVDVAPCHGVPVRLVPVTAFQTATRT